MDRAVRKPEALERIRVALDAVAARRDLQARATIDPVSFVHAYESELDKELVGLIASSLAFGNVKAFRPKIEDALTRLGPSPVRTAEDPARVRAVLRGWKHRVYRDGDLACLVVGARAVQRADGTLGAAFARFYREQGEDLQLAASAFARAIRKAGKLDRRTTRGATHILVDPAGGSAAKRLMLYLRWMVRPADGVDLGLWDLPASKLLIPVDVHIHRLAKNLGLTKRTTASWKAAREITSVLARFDPADPVKYDFSLCHLGMVQSCPSRRDEKRCEGCGVKPVCKHWEKGRRGEARS